MASDIFHFFLFHSAWNPTTLSHPTRQPRPSLHYAKVRAAPARRSGYDTRTACMKHDDIWRALDTLAAENGLSASGLARRSGLDPTTFNPLQAPDAGRPRPLAQHRERGQGAGRHRREPGGLHRTGLRRARPRQQRRGRSATRRIPLIGFAQAGGDGFFDDGGYPVGGGWDEVTLPEIGDPNAYALEISGDSMEPVFRDGDMVIVSPAAPIRRGDRVVVRTTARRGDDQAAHAPFGSPDRAQKPESGTPGLQLRPGRGRLAAPHHLGQPVADQRLPGYAREFSLTRPPGCVSWRQIPDAHAFRPTGNRHHAPHLLAARRDLALPPVAHAAESVDLTLVLVTDVSRSIDDSEFKLEKDGYAAAFTSTQVIEAIQNGRSARSQSPTSSSPPASRCAPCWTGA